jgi:two-component system LytT family sensor kinase
MMKQKLDWILGNRLLQHILFWVAHVVFYGALYGSFQDNYSQTFTEELIYLPVKMAFAYFTLYFLLPRYLLRGEYILFFSWFIVASFAAGIIQRYVAFTLHYPMFYPEWLSESFFWFPKIVKTFAGMYPVAFAAVSIKLLKHWYTNQKAQQILTEEKLEAELKFLKTQILTFYLTRSIIFTRSP